MRATISSAAARDAGSRLLSGALTPRAPTMEHAELHRDLGSGPGARSAPDDIPVTSRADDALHADTVPAGRLRSVEFTIDAAAGIVRTRLVGDVSFADMCVAQDDLFGRSDYSPAMSVVVDCRRATAIPTTGQIRRLALDRLLRRAVMPIGRLAIVADTNVGLEFANVFQTFADDDRDDVRTFTALADALDWLAAKPSVSRSPAAADVRSDGW